MHGSPPLGDEIRRLRTARGVSLDALSRMVHFSKGHLSNVERGARQASLTLARRCDTALEAHGRLVRLFERRHVVVRDDAPAGPAVHPVQLPPATGDLVGRADALAELDRLLEQTDDSAGAPLIILLDGGAGTGKSTLALHWAHRVQDRFPDGVLYADLHGFDGGQDARQPAEVLSLFLQSMAVPLADVPNTLEARSARFRTLAAGQRMLIVLDDAAHAEQIRPLLPGSAGCLVLVTSRSRLAGLVVRDSARRIEIGPLTAEQSVRLLAQLIGSARTDGEPVAAARLARLCDHQPLALRIAAFQIATHPGMPLADAVAQLRSQRHRLSMLDAGDASTAVRTALYRSYRFLPPSAARMFSLLGLHPGSTFEASVAAALSGEDLMTTRAELRMLVDIHMIEQVGLDRYRIGDMVHLYACECLDAHVSGADRADAQCRMNHWYRWQERLPEHAGDRLTRRLVDERPRRSTSAVLPSGDGRGIVPDPGKWG